MDFAWPSYGFVVGGVLLAITAVQADDAVGIFRISVASNDETAIAMPFEPIGVGEAMSGAVSVALGADISIYSSLIGNWIGQWLK